MNPIVKILMERDDMDRESAENLLHEAKKDLLRILDEDGPFSEEAFDICGTWFGLEPDYCMHLL